MAKIKSTQKQTVIHKSTQKQTVIHKTTHRQTVIHKTTHKQTVIHKTTHTTKDGATQTLLRTSDEIKVCLNTV